MSADFPIVDAHRRLAGGHAELDSGAILKLYDRTSFTVTGQ